MGEKNQARSDGLGFAAYVDCCAAINRKDLGGGGGDSRLRSDLYVERDRVGRFSSGMHQKRCWGGDPG